MNEIEIKVGMTVILNVECRVKRIGKRGHVECPTNVCGQVLAIWKNGKVKVHMNPIPPVERDFFVAMFNTNMFSPAP